MHMTALAADAAALRMQVSTQAGATPGIVNVHSRMQSNISRLPYFAQGCADLRGLSEWLQPTWVPAACGPIQYE